MTKREDGRAWPISVTVIWFTLAVIICVATFTSLFENALGSSFGYISLTTVSWLSNRKKDRLFKKKAAELYKFAEFGKLSAGIFHNISNPLTSISLVIEKLKNEGVTDRSIDDIEVAVAASKRMGSLMLAARKHLKSGENERLFLIEKETTETIRLLEYKARLRCVEIKTEFEKDLKIYGDPVKFFQVMENLISNAVDSYEEFDRDSPLSRDVVVVASSKEKLIEISVKDKGCGIPRRLQSMIFKPFFTTKSNREGIGMGLSITRTIVTRDFKGKISLSSKLGKGSTFTVSLPIRKVMY